jgi:hypothetical protein
MKPARETTVSLSCHPLAFQQAQALALSARLSAQISEQNPLGHGQLLAYLVNAGLAIELHFKALMIVARNGRITWGHDLHLLYKEFPPFLTDFLAWQYLQLMPTTGWEVKMTALTHRAIPPLPPAATQHPRYGSFEEAIASSNQIFDDARYFFEKVNDQDWRIFAYAPGALDAVITALEKAYLHFLAGDFAPKPSPPHPHAA